MPRQQAAHQFGSAYVALHKSVPYIALKIGQGLEVAGGGHLVKADDRFLRLVQPVENGVRTDKAGGPSCEYSGSVIDYPA